MKTTLPPLSRNVYKSMLSDTLLKGAPYFVSLFIVLTAMYFAFLPPMTFLLTIGISLLTVIGLVFVILKMRIHRAKKRQQVNHERLQSLGTHFDYYQVNELSAIGVNLSSKRMGVITTDRNGRQIADSGIFDLSTLSSVTAEEPGYTQVLEPTSSRGRSFSQTINDWRWNGRQREAASRRTGLMFKFTDIRKADIFVVLPPAHLEKWFHLFNDLLHGRAVTTPASPHRLPSEAD